MARYIDADAYEFPGDLINEPTVDVVEVVRCCECEYGKKVTINDKGFTICPASGMEITDNDFCSYGERRETE